MELNQLRYFCDVAQTEHMTKSAQRLHIAQPALSQSINRLEEELGFRLFERTGRNIRLTPEGAAFKEKISPLLESLNDAVDEAQHAHARRRSVIRIGIFSASALVVDAIAEFMEHRDDVAFDTTQRESTTQHDIIVSTSPYAKSDRTVPKQNFITCASFEEAIGVAVPQRSSYKSKITLADLTDQQFISLAGSKEFRTICETACARHGFFPASSFVSDNPSVVKKMIGLGLGVGFWPQISWGSLAESDARWVKLKESDFVRTITVSRKASASPAAMEFTDFLVERLSSLWKTA